MSRAIRMQLPMVHRCNVKIEGRARSGMWEHASSSKRNDVATYELSAAHGVGRRLQGVPGEALERGQTRGREEKRPPHLHAVRNQAEPSRNQAPLASLDQLESAIWGDSRRVRNQAEPSRNQALWDECVLRGPIFGGIAPPSNYNIILKMGRPRKGPPGELRKGPPTAW